MAGALALFVAAPIVALALLLAAGAIGRARREPSPDQVVVVEPGRQLGVAGHRKEGGPDMPAAVIYLQPGSVPIRRQAQACLDYCDARGHRVVGVVPGHSPGDAVETVRRGEADLVVTAFAGRRRPGDIRELALAAGVRLEFVRQPSIGRNGSTLVARMYRRSGGNIPLIADMLGETTGEIRATLARAGIRVPRKRPGPGRGA